jgi:hypothetical protein
MIRRTISARPSPIGMTLTLECGHTIWHGGRSSAPEAAECLMHPCYQPQRSHEKRAR